MPSPPGDPGESAALFTACIVLEWCCQNRGHMALRKDGDAVPSVDERVAYLEGRVEDHCGSMADLRTEMREFRIEIRELRGDMNRQFHAMDTKINWVIGSQLAMALAVIGVLLKS